MLAKAATRALQIAPIQAVDKSAWSTLFRAYIDFYGASIPETQYHSTFDRLIDPAKDLHCLVLRTPDGSGEERKLFGIAHFYPHQTPWSEKPIMHLNGKALRQCTDPTSTLVSRVDPWTDLFIDPELRGQGHGRRMIQQVADLAKEQDCLRVEWATKFDNPARKLYDELAECSFVEYRLKF